MQKEKAIQNDMYNCIYEMALWCQRRIKKIGSDRSKSDPKWEHPSQTYNVDQMLLLF